MKILPNTQRLGKLTFDSNQVRKSSTNPNILIAKASDGKDYGVVRKSDGSYDFAGSTRNASLNERLAMGYNPTNNFGTMLSSFSTVMSEPQRILTKKLTKGKYDSPNEYIQYNTKLPQVTKDVIGGLANVFVDPLNLLGTGLLTKTGSKVLPTIGKHLTTKTPLKNAYKINPLAFKPNPEAYYRGVGKEGMEDILQSGIIRSKKIHAYPEPYFSKGKIGDKYAQGYFAELTNEPMKGVGSFNTGDLIQTPVNQISINNPNLKLYQKDWLRGYKEIKNKQNGGKLPSTNKLKYGSI